MGSWITIAGVPPHDGRYPFDVFDNDLKFVRHEWGWIRRMTGYTRLTIGEGFAALDDELWACLAVIALYRAGRIDAKEAFEAYERFGDVVVVDAAVKIELEAAPADDAGPPALSSSGRPSSSGEGTTTSSETTSPPPQNGSGIPDSDISASLLTRSAT